MPELPEVETIARRLRETIPGGMIKRLELLPKARVIAGLPHQTVEGQTVGEVSRRGKLLIIRAGEHLLLFHLGMTGRITLGGRRSTDAACRIIIHGERSGRPFFLHFSDARRFGYLQITDVQRARAESFLGRLGPEATEVRRRELAFLLGATSRPVKSLLLDQSRIAGIGNIYADEILHRSRVHPLTPANSLDAAAVSLMHASIRRVLREAIRKGGSSVRDYLTADGRSGSFQREHRVYRRAGRPCLSCATLIERIVVGGRGTYFCPRCQPPRSASGKP